MKLHNVCIVGMGYVGLTLAVTLAATRPWTKNNGTTWRKRSRGIPGAAPEMPPRNNYIGQRRYFFTTKDVPLT